MLTWLTVDSFCEKSWLVHFNVVTLMPESTEMAMSQTAAVIPAHLMKKRVLKKIAHVCEF